MLMAVLTCLLPCILTYKPSYDALTHLHIWKNMPLESFGHSGMCICIYIYTQYAVLSAYPLTHLPTCRPMYHIYQHIMWSHETDTCANMPLDIHASSTETSIAMCTEIYWHGVMSMGQSTWESSICEKVQRKRRNEQEGTKERKATKREWVMDTSPGRSGNRNS